MSDCWSGKSRRETRPPASGIDHDDINGERCHTWNSWIGGVSGGDREGCCKHHKICVFWQNNCVLFSGLYAPKQTVSNDNCFHKIFLFRVACLLWKGG